MSSLPADEGRPEGAAAEPRSASDLAPGTVLGKYRVTKRLGEGGMGVVFAGTHEKLGRQVAIKLLRRDLCDSQEQTLRFQREAELVTKIGHPNIVAVYDFGRIADGSLYYVMELLSGESFRARLSRGPLGDRELIDTFTQLLSAVNAAHEVGAVHRDLKPENIQLVPVGQGQPPQVKLLDFGVAKIRGDALVDPSAANPPADALSAARTGGDELATAAGALMGTPAYMAPEQIKGSSSVDKRADVYAIGVMIYEAMIGQRPFTGSTGDVMGQHLYKEATAPSVAHVEAKLPSRFFIWDKLDAVVMRALAKDPAARYADCTTLLMDLEAAWGGKRSASMTSLPDLSGLEAAQSRANRAAQRRKLLMRIGGGALALALVGGGVAWKLRPAPQVVVKNLGALRERAAKLIAAARIGEPSAQRDLMAAVALTKSRPFVPVVDEALGSEKPEVWRAAVQAAMAIGQPQDTELREALEALSSDAVGPVAVDVAVARLRCGDAAASGTLTSLASAPTLDVAARLRAVLALAQAGQVPSAKLRSALGVALRAGEIPRELRREVLVQLLLMNDAEAQKQTEQAAAKPGVPGEEPEARAQHIEAVQALALAKKPRGGDLLYSAAKTASGAEHVELVLALAESGDKWAADLVMPLLKDPNGSLRARAAAALGGLNQRGIAPRHPGGFAGVIEPLLGDRDPKVSLTAAVLLADADTVARTAPPAPPAASGGAAAPSGASSDP
jgi:serine/threonine protein kinase/HEAT repeat protein